MFGTALLEPRKLTRFVMFKLLLAGALCFATITPQEPVAKAIPRILMIPLDGRPAAGQFAKMIAAMAGYEVILPPQDLLGRFTEDANVDKIFEWLEAQDLTNVKALIASADMVAYGGLIQSRVANIDSTLAIQRLRRLITYRAKQESNLKFYIYASNMRLTPTATVKAAPYRMNLAKYEEIKDKFERTNDKRLLSKLKNLKAMVPLEEIQRYENTRTRNFEVLRTLMRMVKSGPVDYLIIGQDDAKPDGPQIQENTKLREFASYLELGDKAYFCEGIDQHGNILVSRAILSDLNYQPRVRIVYSDGDGKKAFALYESKPIEESLADQLYASGARQVKPGQEFDYTLYVNTPGRRRSTFQSFMRNLKDEIDQGFPVAVADINFGVDGTSDEELIAGLSEERRVHRLLAFAGWNTAGNTIGTAIPAANVFLSGRALETDALSREVAQREFLLHRMIDDYAYHKYTRPAAYRMIDQYQSQRDEVYGDTFTRINQFVQDDLTKHAKNLFELQFEGKSFFASNKEYRIVGMEQLSVSLPWPRAYEVAIDFKFRVEPVGNQR
jgi:hypothetical protein